MPRCMGQSLPLHRTLELQAESCASGRYLQACTMHLLGAPVLLKGRSSGKLALPRRCSVLQRVAVCCSVSRSHGGSQPFAELCISEVAHAAMEQRSLELDSARAQWWMCSVMAFAFTPSRLESGNPGAIRSCSL